ncbi:hypothetical protein Rsub_13260 [Raphidocelis subcapitata]|uniref:Sulfotransferase n=1 Tax=Raphidocelis subcapitata TaxID=307507 RepID=A0A2V0PLE2_9CHLO|nr:hypothetical protein Rsub_13260 [Raphidocelis subcapitata]|eukprot:GBG00370.1 hypothetical protein Rsub_13260 [Raphidocelis subcapitata]
MGLPGKPAPSVASLLTAVCLGAALGLVLTTARGAVGSAPQGGGSLFGWTSDMLGLGESRAEALRSCTDFACVRQAHTRPGKFNFPHFFIIGFPKAATTSLHAYLTAHPQALNPRGKAPPRPRTCPVTHPQEAQFFSGKGACWHPDNETAHWGCGAAETAHYINHTLRRDDAVKFGMERPAFESTTDYVWGGINMSTSVYELAAGVRYEVPWVKIVISMREPISHQISGKVHTLDMLKNPEWWFNPEEADACVRRLYNGTATMYDCIKNQLKKEGSYLEPLNAWLTAFPPEQVHVIQFENLTGDATRAATLNGVMRFLGMEPELGLKTLFRNNSRKAEARPEGWPMKRAHLEELVGSAQTKAERIADVLERYGFHSQAAWMASWRASWDANLASCKPDGMCAFVPT